MSYSSWLYLFLFLPVLMIIYTTVGKTHRWKVLLCASYIFFYLISGKLLVYLIFSTLSIHHIGLWLSSCKKQYEEEKKLTEDKAVLKAAFNKKCHRILWFEIILQIGLLLFLKYFNFFGSNLNMLFTSISLPALIPSLRLAVPLGISFYTLQGVSYVVDVYQGKINADDNLGRLALYMSFFPIIMEGPICRYSQTAQSLYEGKPITYKNLTFGGQRIIWGLFKKLVIADRLNPLVKEVFGNYSQFGGSIIILASVLYTFQLYMDFSGCIDITIGTGEIFGITIPENFRQPFFAKTASEFWRRWHITLGTWFKDYIFYPITLAKKVKSLGKAARKKYGRHMGQIIPLAIALFGVWLSNGLWHGTGWNYIFYGMYYFTLILLGNIFEPLIISITKALHINRECKPYRAFQSIKLLIIVFIGEMFFRAEGLGAGFDMLKSIFTDFRVQDLLNGTFMNLGLSRHDLFAVILGFIVVLFVGIAHEKGIHIRERVASKNIVFRWSFYYATIIAVIVLGAYGAGYQAVDLIYAGF